MAIDNHYSDFSTQPKFTKYYRLNDFPEAMFLIEAECFDTSEDTIKKDESSAKEIFWSLGIIITLVVLGVLPLYLVLDATQFKSKTTKSKESSAITAPRQSYRLPNY